MSKRNISYVSHEEPDFIKMFKQKVGYKEGPTIDSKVNLLLLFLILFTGKSKYIVP